MSESTDRERVILDEIEQHLAALDPRLAARLAAPGRWLTWRWGVHREWLVALAALAGLSLIPGAIALAR